jgi:thiamine kinase-like enzyme
VYDNFRKRKIMSESSYATEMTRCETITWNTGIPPLEEDCSLFEKTKDVLVRVLRVNRFAYHIAYMMKYDGDEEFVWRIQGPDGYEIHDQIIEWAILE